MHTYRVVSNRPHAQPTVVTATGARSAAYRYVRRGSPELTVSGDGPTFAVMLGDLPHASGETVTVTELG